MKIAGIVIAVIAILLIGLGAFFWTQKSSSPNSPSTPDIVITETTNLKLTYPSPYSTIGLPVVLRGQARVFENQFNYRVKNTDGTILAEGTSQTDAKDAGQFGSFEITVTDFKNNPGTEGFVEIFYYSAKDGSEMENINIPIVFAGS